MTEQNNNQPRRQADEPLNPEQFGAPKNNGNTDYSTEFAADQAEMAAQAQGAPTNAEADKEVTGAPSEEKDARGGNHNPKGANQFTSGRVDDRGRKS